MNHINRELERGFQTAFIDSTIQSNLAYKPQFVSNNYKEGQKVLSTIENELLGCEEFCISVAFITMGGLTSLLLALKTLEERGIRGRILTTDYLMFTDPKALKKLATLSNIELKMYRSIGEGFHTKGYIFKNQEVYKIIVGSSNMTAKALTQSKEWNTKIVSTNQGEYAEDILKEFDSLWNAECAESYEEFIDQYILEYNIIKEQKRIAREAEVPSIEQYKLKPNKMQMAFIRNLNQLVKEGNKRALLLSATGTGKTYAAAFALREMEPKKILFIVHREQIAKQAIKSFKNVFGKTKRFGLLSGTSKDFEADYLFATMTMMAKEDVLKQYRKDEFDVIVVDEVHRAGSNSYQRIMEHFEPGLYLGMTASPERSDDFDIYQLFDHNIAYEIRLQQAMEEDLLCPFHYFGITDLVLADETEVKQDNFRDFNRLISDERVDYIIKQAQYYNYSGERVKGLVFCSRKKEAIELSNKFNERGYKTVALGGDDSQEVRERVVERLTSNTLDDKLDYIFTVDIFNEGVDIPEINQVIMLRPTESPVVFVQQLGRGLRKFDGKEYVIILDFIGNYSNNFMIPIALSGDRSYNKDNIRRFVMEGERIIPGASTIHFDEIAKKKVYESIDTANFNDIRLIKDNYKNLKYKLGHIPRLTDFDKYGEMDVLRIFDNGSLGSYYNFLVKYEKDYKVRLSYEEAKMIEFISKKLANGKRVHELELLSHLINYSTGIIDRFAHTMNEKYHIQVKDTTISNVVNIMTNTFPSGAAKKTYDACIFMEKNHSNQYQASNSFTKMLCNLDFRAMVEELIEFGKKRYELNYSNRYRNSNLELYKKYTYEDVCRLLEWENNEVPLNIGGYKYDKKTKTFPVFINYHKSDDISDTIKYEDHFISPSHLIAISKQGRSIESEDVQNFLHSDKRGISVELFVRKNKDDKISKEFYYLGRMHATGNIREFVMNNTTKTAVEIEWELDKPVREDVYKYLVKD